MKAGWDLVKLGSVCDIQNGFAFDSKLFNNERKGFPLIRIRDIKRGYSETFTTEKCDNAYVVKEGDYLIGMDGEFNIGQWMSENALLNQRVCKLLPSSKILPRFIYYFIPKALKDIEARTAYATVKHLSSKQIKEIYIPNLSLPEQQRIVDNLDQEFAKIDALKANAEKSIQAAKDLFQATLKKALEPKEGWETKHLNEWAAYSIGLTYKPADVSNEGTIVLRSSNIQNDQLVFDDIVRVACKVKDELFVKEGDILMCSRNGSARLVGKVARIGTERERMTYGTFMTIIRSKYNPILFYYFKSDDFRSQISKGENPMINQITKYMLNDVVLSLPNNPKEVSSIARSLDDLNNKCKALQDNYQKTLTLCDDLKQALLRKAFNGEL